MKDYFARTEKRCFFSIILALGVLMYGDAYLWGATQRLADMFSNVSEEMYPQCLLIAPESICDYQKEKLSKKDVQARIYTKVNGMPEEKREKEFGKLIYLETSFQTFLVPEKYIALCEYGLKKAGPLSDEGSAFCECMGQGMKDELLPKDHSIMGLDKIIQQIENASNKVNKACMMKLSKEK